MLTYLKSTVVIMAVALFCFGRMTKSKQVTASVIPDGWLALESLQCLTGPSPIPVLCLMNDADADGDVDLRDFAWWSTVIYPAAPLWNSKIIAAAPHCMNGPAPYLNCSHWDSDDDGDLRDISWWMSPNPNP